MYFTLGLELEFCYIAKFNLVRSFYSHPILLVYLGYLFLHVSRGAKSFVCCL